MSLDELVLKRIVFTTQEEMKLFPDRYKLAIDRFKEEHPIRQNLHPDYVSVEILSYLAHQFGYTIRIYDEGKDLNPIHLYDD